MARRYAAIMALVGMSVTLVRALRNGSTVEATVISALAWMAGLGLVGLVTAAIASATIEESVRTQMERELAQQGAA